MGKFIKKAILFCLIFAVLFQGVTTLLMSKTYKVSPNLNDSFSPYHMAIKATGFYEVEKNTLDVVFLGSSHVHTNINPLVIYNKYGIMGYDFSADQQDFETSYYYAKEVFKHQKPQVLAVEIGLFGFKQMTLPGHYSFDYLPASFNKVKGITDRMNEESYKELLLPIYAYHTRWKELTKEDFAYFTADKQHRFMGHWAYLPVNPQIPEENENITKARFLTITEKECIDKMYQLCKENDCQLLFFKTPSAVGNQWQESNNAIKNYIQEKGYDIVFKDYSFSGIEMNYNKHFVDEVHMNIYGAEKFSRVFGKLLKKYVEPNKSQSLEMANTFEHNWQYYSRVKENYKFSTKKKYENYMKEIYGDTDYVAMIVGQCDLLVEGIDFNEVLSSDNPQWAYCAVIENGTYMFEEFGSERIQKEFTYGDDLYTLVSDPEVQQGSVLVNNRDEQSVMRRGLNIVVYDKQIGEVIDVKNFDIYTMEPIK